MTLILIYLITPKHFIDFSRVFTEKFIKKHLEAISKC